jgi:hypothetical protein
MKILHEIENDRNVKAPVVRWSLEQAAGCVELIASYQDEHQIILRVSDDKAVLVELGSGSPHLTLPLFKSGALKLTR